MRLLGEAAGLDAAQLALVDHVVDPGEQLALPEDRRVDGGVHLVVGADPGVVLEEDVALVDADVHRAVLERPFDDQVGAAAEEEVAGAEADPRPVLGLDRRVEVVAVDDDLAAGDAADRFLVVPVDVPELRAQDLVGDRVEVGVGLGVELERGVDDQLLGRHVAVGEACGAAGPLVGQRRGDRAVNRSRHVSPPSRSSGCRRARRPGRGPVAGRRWCQGSRAAPGR